MNQMIKLDGNGWSITATPEAEKLKKSLLREGSTIKKVEDKGDEGIAIAACSNLASFRKQLEATRKAVKQPVLDLGKKIDSIAEAFGHEIDTEEKRIRNILGGYQMKLAQERQKIEEEARKKQIEATKALEAAEAARLAAEKKQSTMAEVKAERLEEKAIDARVAVMQLEQQAADTKVRGGRMELDFEVEDIESFYNEHPNLCIITVKTRETKEYLKSIRTNGKIPSVFGIRVFEKPVISIR